MHIEGESLATARPRPWSGLLGACVSLLAGFSIGAAEASDRARVNIEGEALTKSALASEGSVKLTSMLEYGAAWSGRAQLIWRPHRDGAILRLQVQAQGDGLHRISLAHGRGPRAANFIVKVGGKQIGGVIEGYALKVLRAPWVDLGLVQLQAGANNLVFTVRGRNPSSAGWEVGIDAIELTPLGPADTAVAPAKPPPFIVLPDGDILRPGRVKPGEPGPAPSGEPAPTPGGAPAPTPPETPLPDGPLPGEQPPEAQPPAADEPEADYGDIESPGGADAPDPLAPTPEKPSEQPATEEGLPPPPPMPKAEPTQAQHDALLNALRELERHLVRAPGGPAWHRALEIGAAKRAASAVGKGPDPDAAIRRLDRKLHGMPDTPVYRALLARPAFKRVVETLAPWHDA